MCRSSRIEVSPYNSRARRVPGGIWNEDVLPVVEWEAAEHRVVLPEDLQHVLSIEAPVLRWARGKRERVFRERRHVTFLLDDPTSTLARWRAAGPDFRNPGEADPPPFLVFARESEMWIKAVFGLSREGSMNFISLYGTTRERDINRWRKQWHHEGMVWRDGIDPSSAG